MQFKTNFTAPTLKPALQHHQSVMLIGSCFTEHMSKRLAMAKMQVMQNPNGILFNPISVSNCINDIITNKTYTADSLIYINEAWQHWQVHSNYGHMQQAKALQNINDPIQQAHKFIQQTDWLIITLGSAFAYWHNELQIYVSNNHRAPASVFTKKLLPVTEITNALQTSIDALLKINPSIQILFTISPVRHLRDGLIDNNRSKARLIEATHHLCEVNNNVQYFPAYEIVIDELRDYRFYDIDFAHPNYMATEYVWQQFMQAGISHADHTIFSELMEIHTALNHKVFNEESEAHKNFKQKYLTLCYTIKAQFPYIDLAKEIAYFN